MWCRFSDGIIGEYAAMAQLVEHILGKDEVISSTLISSSRKACLNDRLFSLNTRKHVK